MPQHNNLAQMNDDEIKKLLDQQRVASLLGVGFSQEQAYTLLRLVEELVDRRIEEIKQQN